MDAAGEDFPDRVELFCRVADGAATVNLLAQAFKIVKCQEEVVLDLTLAIGRDGRFEDGLALGRHEAFGERFICGRRMLRWRWKNGTTPHRELDGGSGIGIITLVLIIRLLLLLKLV